MKVIDDTQYRLWISLWARSVKDDPYRTILICAERLADALEDNKSLTDYNKILSDIEEEQNVILTVGDVGEICVLLSSFWIRGHELLSHMSFIEGKIIAENVQYRLAILARDAQKVEQ